MLDNIKEKILFLHDEEEKKIQEPTLPETAKDIFDDAEEVRDEPDERLEKEVIDKAPDELPDFPDMEKKPSKKSSNPKPDPVKKDHRIIPDSAAEMPPPMEDEIKKFESSLEQVYTPDYLERDTEFESTSQQDERVPQHNFSESEKGFFYEFHRFLEGHDVPYIADELLHKDLLDKMKEYHMHKEEGKPYYFHTKELKEGLNEKMLQLRNLERDWYVHKQRIEREEKLLIQKEEEIDDKLQELKHVMSQLKKRSDFLKEAPKDEHFRLSNGHVLKSLSDLRAALRVMSSPVFYDHVRGEKNDFAEWVEEVFKHSALAQALRDVDTKEEMIEVLTQAEISED